MSYYDVLERNLTTSLTIKITITSTILLLETCFTDINKNDKLVKM